MPKAAGLFATPADHRFARAVGPLLYGNPFLPARLDAERAALGPAFDPAGTLWHVRAEPGTTPNLVALHARAAAVAEAARARLAAGAPATAAELAAYEDVVLYVLYDRVQAGLFDLVHGRVPATRPVAAWATFRRDLP